MPNVFGGSHAAYIQMVAVVGEHTKLMLTHNENRSIIPYVCESAHVLLGTNLLGTNLLGPSLSPCTHLSQFVAPLTLIVNHVFQYRQKRGIWGPRSNSWQACHYHNPVGALGLLSLLRREQWSLRLQSRTVPISKFAIPCRVWSLKWTIHYALWNR